MLIQKSKNNSIKLICEKYNLDFDEVTFELTMFNWMFKTKYDEFNINKKYHICYVVMWYTNRIY